MKYNCSFHQDKEAVGGCYICSRNLCPDCYYSFDPPICPRCAKKSVRVKRKLRRYIKKVKKFFV